MAFADARETLSTAHAHAQSMDARSAADAQAVVQAQAAKARADADVATLRGRLAQRDSHMGGSEEIAAYKTLLNCQVCNSRQKAQLVAKCGHMFCSPCVRANLETRLRKCPACGKGFGAEDVRPVFF